MGNRALADRTDLKTGQILGRYRVTNVIGESVALGKLYAAARVADDASVAIRVVPEPAVEAAALKRFVDTARAAAKLHRKHMSDVLDHGELPDGRTWVAQGISEGRTLQAMVVEQPLEPIELLAVLRGVARAVDLAHDRGLVHGQLEASSICLSNDSEGQLRARVLEFGAWHLVPAPNGLRPGSPKRSGYAPGVTGDIKALGVLCFEALTGTPYADDAPRVSDLRPELGPHFDDAVEQVLDADRRPRSGHDVFEAFRAAAKKAGYGDGGIPAPPSQPVDDSTRIEALDEAALGVSLPAMPE